MSACSQGWGIISRRANNNCWGDVCKAQTWRRHWTVCPSFASLTREWRTMNSSLLLLHCAPGMQSQSCYLLGSTWCRSQPQPHVQPWLNYPQNYRTPLFPPQVLHIFWSQQVHELIAVLSLGIPCSEGYDIQIVTPLGMALYFCWSVWAIPTLVQSSSMIRFLGHYSSQIIRLLLL